MDFSLGGLLNGGSTDNSSPSDSNGGLLASLSDLASSTVQGIAGSAATAAQRGVNNALNPTAGAAQVPAPDVSAKAATPTASYTQAAAVSAPVVLAAIGIAFYLMFSKKR